MKTKIILSILAFGIIVSVFGQKTIELTYSAIESANYEQLDSIKVMNRTQGGDTVLFYPDTVLFLDYQLGISETNTSSKGLQIFQNYPNPVVDKTTISFYVPEKGKVSLIVTDMLGRLIIKTEQMLNQGYHSYLFTPGNGSLFLFTVQWRGNSNSIKILQTSPGTGNECTIEYICSEDSSPELKASEDIQSFLFSLGDTLLYIGYYDTLQSGVLDTPDTSETYTFQFATNIPCPGMPTVTHEGLVYNTIQIFSQCWLKENLNVGTMILLTEYMSDNDTIERYCYDNNLDTCAKYGGLYQWNEVMNYNTNQGIQGICPPGWHIPTDEEWKVLEGAVDSYYGIGNPDWDNMNYLGRGIDAGTNLKTTSGWYENGNGIDIFGFSGQPGGFFNVQGPYVGNISVHGTWWSSTQVFTFEFFPLFRQLAYGYQGVARGTPTYNADGYSVRCLKDN